MSGYTLRPATETDQWLLADILLATAVIRNIPFDEKGADSDVLQIATAYRAQGGEMWVLEYKGAVFGCAGVQADGHGGASLRRLCLAPNWRGMGLGRMLVDIAREHALKKRLSPFWVRLVKEEGADLEFYQKSGFKVAEPPAWLSCGEGEIYLQMPLPV